MLELWFEHPQKNARSGAMRNHQSWATGLCLAVLMAACDSETGPAGSPTDLCLSEANDIGAAFEDDTDVSLGALISGGTLNNADVSVGVLSAPAMNGAPPRPGLECLVIEPMPPEDPDLDGVPTRLSVHFDPQACVIPTDRGVSFIFTGALGVADPTPQTAAYDIDETYDHFGHSVAVTGGRSFLVVRNGERHVRQEASHIGAVETFASVHVVNEERRRNAAAEWGLRFAGEEPIVFGQPFPSGSLSIGGTWAFSHEDADRLFRVETATPLHYDATCTDARPVRRISEGVIHKLLVVNGERVGVLVMTWVGCGRPPIREWHRFDEGDRPTDRPTDRSGSDTA
jgi:hypothetical protein